jgi:hypothetical protein
MPSSFPIPGVAHHGIPGPAPYLAEGLFAFGVGAAAAAWWVFHHRSGGGARTATVALGIIAACSIFAAPFVPVFLGARLSLSRASSTASLTFVSPTDGQAVSFDAGGVDVQLQLDGGQIVSFTSLHVQPDQGHIHLSLDGKLVAMTGLEARIPVPPGTHRLQAEFVAADHLSFDPPVTSTVTFTVGP